VHGGAIVSTQKHRPMTEVIGTGIDSTSQKRNLYRNIKNKFN